MHKLLTVLTSTLVLVSCVNAPKVTSVGEASSLSPGATATVYADSGVPGEILVIQKVDGATTWEGNRPGTGYAKAIALVAGKHQLEVRTISGESRSLVAPMVIEKWLQGDGKVPVDLVAKHHYVLRYDLVSKPGFVLFKLDDLGTSVSCEYSARRQDGRNYFPLACKPIVESSASK